MQQLVIEYSYEFQRCITPLMEIIDWKCSTVRKATGPIYFKRKLCKWQISYNVQNGEVFRKLRVPENNKGPGAALTSSKNSRGVRIDKKSCGLSIIYITGFRCNCARQERVRQHGAVRIAVAIYSLERSEFLSTRFYLLPSCVIIANNWNVHWLMICER